MTISKFTIDTNEYNSYAALAEADRYLRVDLNRWPTWNAISAAETKQILLINATRMIDLHQFTGELSMPDQPLQWPRNDVPGLPDNVLPDDIVHATALLAVTVHSNPAHASIMPNARDPNVKRQQLGPLVLEFYHPESVSQATDITIEGIDADAYALISKYFAVQGTGTGDLNDSNNPAPNQGFYDNDRFDVTGPY